MKHKAFMTLVIVSLVLVGVFSYGLFVEIGPSIGYLTPAPNGHVTIHALDTLTAAGGMEIYTSHGTGPLPQGTHMGWNFFFRHGGPTWPSARALWKFEAHAVPAGSVAPGYSADVLAFPLWCLIVPSLIAPSIWLRKRLNSRREVRGFAVEPAA